MEYEVERTQLSGFDILQDTTLLQEETLEMIVPDACPDILRIIETDGDVLLRNKTVREGWVEVEACFRLCVLYEPDGESGVRHLQLNIPFTCRLENKDITIGCRVVSELRLQAADTRAVNPRKVLGRGEAAVDFIVFCPAERRICTGILNSDSTGIEMRMEQHSFYQTECVQENSFPISSQISLPAGQTPAAELLHTRVSLHCGETKLIGSKMIYKGFALLQILYREADGRICTHGEELPFSQITEVSGAAEQAECEVILAVQELQCEPVPGNSRCFDVKLDLVGQLIVREVRQLKTLVDAYSTREPVDITWDSCPAYTRMDTGTRSQNVRELWETADPVNEVVDSRVILGPVSREHDGDHFTIRVQANVCVLCLDENGQLCAAQRMLSVPCTLDLPADCRCYCHTSLSGEVYANPSAGGVEVRFAVEFYYCAEQSVTLPVLTDVRAGEIRESDGGGPSLVLRMMEQNEKLWDVAKAYRTTIADIMNANDLQNEAEACGRLLLIPRSR